MREGVKVWERCVCERGTVYIDIINNKLAIRYNSLQSCYKEENKSVILPQKHFIDVCTARRKIS